MMSAKIVLPGLIDCHVHFREPGLEHKATIASEAAAARAGGVVVVCEMPNTNPGTNCITNLADKVRRANEVRKTCDVRFFFGATLIEHVNELEKLWTDPANAALKAMCSGLKLYLDNSTGNMKSDDAVNEAAFALCGKLGITLVAHCEHAATNEEAAAAIPYSDAASHSARRPAKSEVTSIGEAIALARRHGTPLHIAHLSTAGGLDLVRQARKDGLRVTCEVTPHHLMLSTDDYEYLRGRGKVNPPLRAVAERDALWKGVLDGTVDCISTDHAPHLLGEKDVETGQPPSGLPCVENSLSLLLSVALGRWPHPKGEPSCPPCLKEALFGGGDDEKKKPIFSTSDIVRLMFTNPNKIFNLNVAPESVPQLVVDVTGERTIEGSKQVTKCKWSPYDGWTVRGTFSEK